MHSPLLGLLDTRVPGYPGIPGTRAPGPASGVTVQVSRVHAPKRSWIIVCSALLLLLLLGLGLLLAKY
eukprot:3550227-Rhodomonas_salina.1